MTQDLESKINGFFATPYLTSTYKIVLFKAILVWAQDIEVSDTTILSLDSIAEFFLKTYFQFFRYKELHHLTNKEKTIDFFNLLDKQNSNKQEQLTNEIISSLTDEAKTIIIQDVIYRFRNNCCIYEFVQLIESKMKILSVPNKIEEKEYLDKKSKITHLKFEKIDIEWLRKNNTLLKKSLNYLLVEFLYKLNSDQPNIINKIMELLNKEK